MKVLLVQPPLSENMIELDSLYLPEPLALETVGASIPNHDVRILDMRLELNLEKELDNFHPDVVATTSYTPEVYRASKILEKAKEYNHRILTVIGGHYATIMPQDFDKKFIDVIVIGEGELTFRELIDTYETGGNLQEVQGVAFCQDGRRFFSQPRELIANLDETPMPFRHLTERYRDKYFCLMWRPYASLMTSRGCVFKCNFCSVWKHEHGKYRARSPERTIRELLSIKEKYISIFDDDFLQNPKRAESIYEIISERHIEKTYKFLARADSVVRSSRIIGKWKDIGLKNITLGLESFRDEELQAFNKGTSVQDNEEAIQILHENGITISSQFIINPNYTKEDFEALAKYVQKMKLSRPLFTVLTPMPGTDLYEEMKDQLLTHNLEMFDFVHSVLPTRLPRKEFYKYYADLFLRCYSVNNGNEGHGSLPQGLIQRAYSYLTKAYDL